MNRPVFTRLLALGLLLAWSAPVAHAQQAGGTWGFAATATSAMPGQEIDLIFRAKLDKDWLTYASDFEGDVGPQPTAVEFLPNGTFEPVGPLVSVGAKRKVDKTWGTEVGYFTGRAEYRQRVRILRFDYFFTGVIRGQWCSEKKGLCVPFEEVFSLEKSSLQPQ